MPKKGGGKAKGKGKGKGRKKGKKGKKSKKKAAEPLPEPALEAAVPPVPPDELLELPLPCVCGQFIICLLEDPADALGTLRLCISHQSGSCLSCRSDEPYGQFVFEGHAGSRPVKVLTNGDQKQLRADDQADPRCRAQAKAVWVLREAEPYRFIELASGWCGAAARRHCHIVACSSGASCLRSVFSGRRGSLGGGFRYGHGTHMIEGHGANWMVGWDGGAASCLHVAHSAEPAESQFRLTATSGGGALFTSSYGGDPYQLQVRSRP